MSNPLKQPLIFMILAALAGGVWVGLRYPAFVTGHPQISLAALIGIFFLSSLTIDMASVLRAAKDIRTVGLAAIFTLFVLPLAIYTATAPFSPTLALSFLILAAMPAGMTAPLLAELAGGEKNTALVVTVATSLLAPLTVPFVISLAAGQSVHVDSMAMFLRLGQVIIIPFTAAQIVRIALNNHLSRIAHVFTPVSTFLLGILILFIVAKRPHEIASLVSGGGALRELLAICLFFILLHIIGYMVYFKKAPADRVALTVCMAYVNFTLAVDLADKFFSAYPGVVLPVVLSVIPWALLFIPFRAFTRHVHTTNPIRTTSSHG
ncbi:MAG: hypothetical protein HGA67_01260 [Candidatus Yonathbacteria bacterium]|nr:hypothetical protein [Candidatus Yonathbacteria bacterium]